MKQLLILFLLLPLSIFAQNTFQFSHSALSYTDLKGDFNEAVVDKAGYIQFSDSTVIYFEAPSQFCHKEYKDTMQVAMKTKAINGGEAYIISSQMYFVVYPTEVLVVRKVGETWLYETLKP